MDLREWTAGAWPAQGIGPREGVRPGVRWPSHRDDSGRDGPTRSAAQSPDWRRAGHNLWVPADVDPTDPDQRVVEAAALLPGRGGVTGWAGLRWLGGSWFEGVDGRGNPLPVPVAVGSGHRRRPHPSLVVSQEVLTPDTVVRHEGLRVTEPLWSVGYEMRTARTDEAAVVAFEMAAYDDLVSVDELADFVDSSLWQRWGVERVRRVLPLLEENSWSPMEPVMRLAWTLEAGFPRPLANCPVFDLGGRFIGTPDLLDPAAGVFGLYDGGLHLHGKARHADVVKDAAYRALGLEGVVMMAGDLADRDPFALRLRDAYARAGRRPSEHRRWLGEPPPWWLSTATVAERRALTVSQRSRYLTYRPAA
ncbi:hypothetical protein [Nocardioides okcheonensis]|uniref:hypothetical protein n=1 Tax=Nocardioides okcheonensis TaxID=2894081 RepID=UPI001E29D6C4|nr:hypothetical protein [Nocardioides okcheonensis]UFN46627.1 hypothetical protein LN652_10635 [Nocardioides okcheonensis]